MYKNVTFAYFVTLIKICLFSKKIFLLPEYLLPPNTLIAPSGSYATACVRNEYKFSVAMLARWNTHLYDYMHVLKIL